MRSSDGAAGKAFERADGEAGVVAGVPAQVAGVLAQGSLNGFRQMAWGQVRFDPVERREPGIVGLVAKRDEFGRDGTVPGQLSRKARKMTAPLADAVGGEGANAAKRPDGRGGGNGPPVELGEDAGWPEK